MIDQKYNVAFDLFKFLKDNPKQICFESEHGKISGKDFATFISVLAMNLLVREIKPRELIGLDIEDPVLGLAITQAIGAIGASWVKVTQAVLEAELPIKHIIFDTKRMYHGASVHPIDKSWFQMPEGVTNDMRIRGYRDENDIWMIAQSSGSTGQPKFIPITFKQHWHRVWDMNINMFDRRIQYFFTLFMPLKTSAQYHSIAAIFRKITVITNTKPENVVAYPRLFMLGSVMQTHKFISMIKAPTVPYDVDSESTGAAMSKTDLEKFLKYFKIVQSNYGSTETTRNYQKRYTSMDQYMGDIGEALLPDISLEIVDDLDNKVAVDTVGNVRLCRTPRHVDGYYQDPEETAAKFKQGYFYPGDMGYVDEAGRVFITGRKNTSMLNIGGIKIDPAAVEEVINTIDGVDASMVFKNTTFPMERQLSIFIVSKADSNVLANQIGSIVSKQIGVSHVPRTLYFVDAIPLNDNGKPWRSAAERFAAKIEPTYQILSLDSLA